LGLLHRSWDGERWLINDGFSLSEAKDFSDSVTGAAISPQGNLGVIFTADSWDESSESAFRELLFTNREYELGEALPSPPPLPAAPTVVPTPTIQPTPEPTPTPTVVPLSVEQPQSGMFPLNNSFAGIVVAALLALIVVGLSFAVYLILARNR
jgi:hypothetical protein